MRLTAQDIEIAVAEYFGARQNVVVPNVSWGLNLNYEADLVVLRPSGWASEIEIKVSASDLRADRKKRRWRQHPDGCPLFHQYYMAVPETLRDTPEIPPHAGVLSCESMIEGSPTLRCTLYRAAKRNPEARKFSDAERLKLLELAHMRIWTLKRHIQGMRTK